METMQEMRLRDHQAAWYMLKGLVAEYKRAMLALSTDEAGAANAAYHLIQVRMESIERQIAPRPARPPSFDTSNTTSHAGIPEVSMDTEFQLEPDVFVPKGDHAPGDWRRP